MLRIGKNMFSVALSVVRRRSVSALAFFGVFVLLPISSFAVGNLSLAWDPSPDGSVVSYKVYYGTASGVYNNSIATSGTTMTVSNLVEGVTYYFAATSLDGDGLESDFSSEVSGAIIVPNLAPTLNALSNISVNEDASAQIVNLSGISSGSASESQTLTVTATSSNTGLIPNPTVNYTSPNATGSIAFTPVASAFGSATITVTVNDGASSNNVITRSFTVTVNPVNDSPALNALSNVSVNEDASAQTINLSGISSGAANESQTLTVTATSSNTGLIPNPTVNYTSPNATGSISFTPVASAFGSATITVSVNDGGSSNNVITRSFTVTVNPVNDTPTLNTLSNVSINQNASSQTVNLSGISSGAANENQTLTVTATSSNTGLIPNPSVSYTSPSATGSISFQPVASAFGSATITVSVHDGGSSNNVISRSFTVTVNKVNQPPSISTITNLSIAMDTSADSIPFTISDAETASSSLTLSANSSNRSLVPNANITFGGSNGNRTVTVVPLSGQIGATVISVIVSDGTATTTNAFELTVNLRPMAPANLRLTAQ